MNKTDARKRRHMRFFKKKHASTNRPRIVVGRSNRHMYVQLVDDSQGKTLSSVSSLKHDKKKPMEKAKLVAEEMVKKLKEHKINTICFDKNGFTYHGKVKMVAETLREAGIKF